MGECQYYKGMEIKEEATVDTVNDTTVSTERRDRAVRLNNRIRANNALAAQCILEIAKDLKTMNAERLYTEVGCGSFGEYCETLGMRERHGYNFISLLDRFGEEQLGALQKYGVTKLIEMSKLDDEDLTDLIGSGTVEDMTVKELKEKIREYERQTEQLTLDLDSAENDLNESDRAKASAESERDEIKAQLALMDKQKKELEEKIAALEENDKKQTDRFVEMMQINQRQMDELKALHSKENKEYREKIRALKENQAEKAEVSEEQLAAIRAEAEKAAQEKADKEREAAVKEAVKKADESRIAAVDAARKQEQKKYSDELEKLRTENQRLQSIAEKSAPVADEKEKIRFFLGEIQRSFNAAVEVISAASSVDREKYRAAMRTALERMGGVLNAE